MQVTAYIDTNVWECACLSTCVVNGQGNWYIYSMICLNLMDSTSKRVRLQQQQNERERERERCEDIGVEKRDMKQYMRLFDVKEREQVRQISACVTKRMRLDDTNNIFSSYCSCFFFSRRANEWAILWEKAAAAASVVSMRLRDVHEWQVTLCRQLL